MSGNHAAQRPLFEPVQCDPMEDFTAALMHDGTIWTPIISCPANFPIEIVRYLSQPAKSFWNNHIQNPSSKWPSRSSSTIPNTTRLWSWDRKLLKRQSQISWRRFRVWRDTTLSNVSIADSCQEDQEEMRRWSNTVPCMLPSPETHTRLSLLPSWHQARHYPTTIPPYRTLHSATSIRPWTPILPPDCVSKQSLCQIPPRIQTPAYTVPV